MSPATHLLLGWLVGESAPTLIRRERACIALAGVIPDLDGFGVIPDLLTRHTDTPTRFFHAYHHVLFHNGLAAVVVGVLCGALASGGFLRRVGVAALATICFNLHLFCDVIGAKGPDGNQWPIPYLTPFAESSWTWSGQWRLDSWQNLVITLVALAIIVVLALRRGRTPVEMVSLKADAAVVNVIRRRFGRTP